MLKTDEIRDICKKNGLTRMEVYNIRSQFAGMCLMSKEDELKEKYKAYKYHMLLNNCNHFSNELVKRLFANKK